MFLFNFLLDLTDELDMFCRTFAAQNTSAFLYSTRTYQTEFPPPHPGYEIPPPFPHLFQPSFLLGTQE